MKNFIVVVFLLLCALLCGCGQEKDYTAEAAALREAINTASPDKELKSFGEWTPDAETFGMLEREIKKLTDTGCDIGLLMIDIDTKNGLGFNTEQVMCSQSTIKGPYVASVYEAEPESFSLYKEKIRKTLKYSDNDCYESLRGTYRSAPIRAWTETCGLRSAIASGLYVQYTAKEFASLWTEMYRFFNTCENQELKDFYIGSKYSAVYAELGGEYTVRSKAGWEDGDYGGKISSAYLDKNPYNDEVATNDGALVSTGNGDYILVLLTDISADPQRLQPLIRAIDNVHKAMR